LKFSGNVNSLYLVKFVVTDFFNLCGVTVLGASVTFDALLLVGIKFSGLTSNGTRLNIMVYNKTPKDQISCGGPSYLFVKAINYINYKL